jgi:hypothetical protein
MQLALASRGCAMAYYKVRIEVWCDWNPAESDLEDIAQSMAFTLTTVV